MYVLFLIMIVSLIHRSKKNKSRDQTYWFKHEMLYVDVTINLIIHKIMVQVSIKARSKVEGKVICPQYWDNLSLGTQLEIMRLYLHTSKSKENTSAMHQVTC